ncbi:MAG: cation transporter [Ruminococcaceae bacterium]|nr:cation transporter [Oscillospiraceae bacterium]
MTKMLLSLFVKNPKNTDDPKTRSAIGSLSGIVGIVCNLLLFAGKLAVGTLAGSVSITADAMNNLSDASSAIVTLIGFKLAEKPADADHPYGHARYEYLSGLAVAALIIVIGVELGQSSIEKIFHPQTIEFSWMVALTLVLSIGVKLWLSLFNGKLSRLIGSSTLAATAQDSRNDVIATAAVLVAAVIEYFTHFSIDGYVGLAVSAFILYSGGMLAKETISPLLGESASPELQALIVDYIQKQPKVLGYHDLMVHDYGPGQRFATLHVEMDNREDPLLCHELIDDMERECLQEHNVHLVIHYDPVVTDDPELLRLRDGATAILTSIDPRLRLHDFRMVRGNGHTNLIFDISLPADMNSRKEEIKAKLEDQLSQQEQTAIYTVITFDPMAFNEEI